MDKHSLASTMENNTFAPGTDAHSKHIQTEALVPVCICGRDLIKTDSKVYGLNACVLCDNCGIECYGDDVVFIALKQKMQQNMMEVNVLIFSIISTHLIPFLHCRF